MLHFKPLFDRRNELQQDAAKQKVALDQQNQMLVQTQETLAEKEKQYPEVKQAFENRFQLKEKSAELQKIIQLNQLQQDRKVISGRMEKGVVFLQDTEQDIARLQQQQDILTEKIKEQKNNLPDLIVISAISNWFVQKNALLSAMQKTIQEKTVKEKLVQLSAKRKAVFTTSLRKVIAEVNADDTATLVIQLKSALEYSEQLLQNAAYELQRLLLQQELEDHAANLKPGEPCPLCGAMDHPQILSVSHVKAEVKKMSTAKEASQYLVLGAKCNALLNKKYSPDIEDVRAIASAVLRHRMVRNFKAEAEGITVDSIVSKLLAAHWPCAIHRESVEPQPPQTQE